MEIAPKTSPLERGSYPRYKSLVINKKTAFQTFLFRRGRGRCCQFFFVCLFASGGCRMFCGVPPYFVRMVWGM